MNLPPLREVIAAHGLSASKALGQNFLLDEQLLARIAAIPGDLTDRAVLGAVLDFLGNHEPDLLLAADALNVEPKALIAAREALAR